MDAASFVNKEINNLEASKRYRKIYRDAEVEKPKKLKKRYHIHVFKSISIIILKLLNKKQDWNFVKDGTI